MQRKFASVCAAAAAVVTASFSSPALGVVEAWWQGGTGNLLDPNYFRFDDAAPPGTPNAAPAAGDYVNFAAGGIGTYNSGTEALLGRLRIGYNSAPVAAAMSPAAYTGTGTLTVSGAGTKISLNGGAANPVNAALWVGNVQNGTLNIEDGANITSNRLAVIGVGSNTSRTGNLNISGGGSLNVTLGNISLGDGTTNAANGVQGHVNISGAGSSITVADIGGDLNVGARGATSTFTQSGGTVTIGDAVEVGLNNVVSIGGVDTQIGTNSNSTLSVSGGTFSNGANFFVGRGATTGATVNLSGDGTINVGTKQGTVGRFLMGGQTATGIVMNHSGGTLNTWLDVRVADAGTGDATYNFSGGTINSTTGGYVGRQGTGVFNQTGGIANFNGTLNIGNRDAATGANSGLYKISGGTLNLTGGNLNVATSGIGEFRVIGDDGVIDLNGNFNANTGANGNSTLAFQLEAGDAGLSLVDVAGTATFASGANLTLDFAGETTALPSFDLLTATTIADGGLNFTGPSGWTYQIVTGGSGQILRALAPVTGGTYYWDTDGPGTPGAGGASPSGAWDGAVANFNSDPAGGAAGSAVAVTTASDDVVFAAGADGGGTYAVTVTGTQAANSVTVARGDVTLAGGTLATGAFNVAAGANGTVSSLVSGNATGSVTKTGAGTLTLTANNTYTGGTYVQAGTLRVNRLHENNAVNIAGGKLQVIDSSPTLPNHPSGDNSSVSRPSSLAIANNGAAIGSRTYDGQLDLGNNDLILDYDGASPIADIEDMVRAGYNGGNWLGNGIASSTANANSNFAIGVADNARLTNKYDGTRLFSGQAVDETTILVKFTHRIDLDLDGVITTNDATIFNSNYTEGQPAYWSIGDLDYDRVFTTNDATLFNSFYSEALASVPEPATLGVLALGGFGALGLRRRRNC